MSSKLIDIVTELGSIISIAPGRIHNLSGSSAALLLALQEQPFIMVESSEERAQKLWEDIMFYRGLLGRETDDICLFPAPNGPRAAGERAEAVRSLFHLKTARSLVASEEGLDAGGWPPDELEQIVFPVVKGQEIGRAEAQNRLAALGYARVSLVTQPGQFSVRGWILDIFPSTAERPVRAEFFGDEVDSLREFDIETQRSVGEVAEVMVLPARNPDNSTSLLDLMPGAARFQSEEVQAGPEEGSTVLSEYAISGEGLDAGLLSIRGVGITPEERRDIYGLATALNRLKGEHRVVIVSSSENQAKRLKEVLMESDLVAPVIDLGQVLEYEGRVLITIGGLSAGLFLPGLLILTEQEVFGGRPSYRPIKKSSVAGLLVNIDDLRKGDFVVHEDRGVGRFVGLVHQKVEGVEYDLIVLEYQEGDRIYLPVDFIHKIRKFHAEEGVVPALDSLRTKRWQKTKERVRKRIKEMADRLLRIYAERSVAEGHAFSPDTELHREFDSFFPYEETPDQVTAIADIKRDMESSRPMERLLAGDVGYGKTEVAMRAAFKAVYDGKQVAVLVPTTLLCEQHLRIFKKRFSAFPVAIEGLSRFKSKKEKLEILKRMRTGEVDIVISTHALLRDELEFHDLGLLIVDEEHRFGVRQKERIKELKRGVDVLSMSATPIPRTLQMSLSGIRSMSVIETPPEERLAVKTVVSVFNDDVVREAVDRELHRGGQAFFVHNRIQDIEKLERRLRKLAPLARVATAHGQMPERTLEKIMLSFLNMEIDVLLSTAIVGSGLDIPTANTIVIDMAHRMGLADLYQLRGRVGRSNVKGYAYFLVPRRDIITEEAKKRLQAIQEMSYMGAGFRLAMKDLEIRGAGNLLGGEQSGNIRAVGFDLYVEMLEEAVAELKGVEVKEKVRPEIRLRLDAFIPEDYIEDMVLRLSTYRRLSAAGRESVLREIGEEMADRFGPLPRPFENLLHIVELKLLAERLSVSSIKQVDGTVQFTLMKDAPLTADGVLKALGGKVKFFTDGFGFPARDGERVYHQTKSALEALLAQE